MKTSAFFKYFLSFFLAVLCLFGSLLTVIFRRSKTNYLYFLTNQMKQLNATLGQFIPEELNRESLQKISWKLGRLKEAYGLRFTLVDHTGRVLVDSSADIDAMDNHANRPEIREAIANGIGTAQRYSTTLNQSMLYVATVLRDNQGKLLVIRSSLPLTDIRTQLGNFSSLVFWSVIASLIISLALGFWISWMVLHPLTLVKKGLEKISLGEFSVRLPLGTTKEFAQLASYFNEMASNLNQLFSLLKNEQEKIVRVFSSISDAVCLFSSSTKAVLWNTSFSALTAPVNPEDKTYWELLPESELIEMLDNSWKDNRTVTAEISWQNRIYLATVVPILSSQERLLLLRDITEIKTLDKQKSEFIADLAHQLRTPLTAIKGFAETITVQEEKERHYLDIIKKHTDRLIALINDLLLLSKIENGKVRFSSEAIRLEELLQEVLPLFHKEIENKGLKLTVDLQPDLEIVGDRFYLQQMLINLLDNAVKYTEKGEIKLT
ncbi:MAG: HAMP domain-containing protein, partial [Candidatus Omnitrophica bacterium]|nr:HAMP domain-containing protein [Candidatus Omnitrophota bacterium]